MHRFAASGAVEPEFHYTVTRTELIEQISEELAGSGADTDGYYLTIHGPLQSGKTTIMRGVAQNLRRIGGFEVVMLNMLFGEDEDCTERILSRFVQRLRDAIEPA